MTTRLRQTLITAGLVALPTLALADPGAGGYVHHEMGWGGWFLGPLMMVLFIGLLVGGVLVILKFLGFESESSKSDRALEILDERLARGEIDKDEYEERKKLLSP